MEQQNPFFEFVCGGSQVTGAFSDFLRLGILSSTEKGHKQVYQSIGVEFCFNGHHPLIMVSYFKKVHPN